MPSLLVTSQSNYKILKKMGEIKYYSKIYIVKNTLSKKMKRFKGKVTGIGGGSVIDTAKLLALPNPCHAIPTTASGAAVTSHAVIWGKNKIDVKTPIPILSHAYLYYPIKLNSKTLKRTIADCFCHIIESKNSKKSNQESIFYCGLAERYFMMYLIS